MSFVGKWASLSGILEGELAVPVVTADSDGTLTFSWRVSAVPTASVDAAPRVYAIQASGAGPAGGIHTAYMLEPVVAYPGTVPCAVPDSATTPLGTTIRVDVLANDAAPAGGSLDASTVSVRAAAGGVFSADAATGAVSFVPVAEGYSGW